MSTTETVLNANETNNAISTEPVNKALDGQNVILAADRDNPLEVRDVSVNKEGKEETKRQIQETLKDSPTAVSDVHTQECIEIKDFEEHYTPEVPAGSSYTESPVINSQEELEDDDDDDDELFNETTADERMTLIEEEYIDRITLLERRNYELEAVLFRLTSAVERLLCISDDGDLVDDDTMEVDEVYKAEDEKGEESKSTSNQSEDRNTSAANQEKEENSSVKESTSKPESSPKCENNPESDKRTEGEQETVDIIQVKNVNGSPEMPKAEEEEYVAMNSPKSVKEDSPRKPEEKEKDNMADSPPDLVKDVVNDGKPEEKFLADNSAQCVSRHLCIELFVEFQRKLAMFAGELKGVLNCSESAIRHGRVVQEWGKSVQLMFEQLLHERKKMMNFIEEREQSMIKAREQFIAEKEQQGKQLQQLVDEMKRYSDLMQTAEDVCREKAVENSYRRSVADSFVELLLEKRLDEERAVILSLARQSKISEMKLFIMHQQNCIQDLQIQNKELRAVIEGLVGSDDMEDTDPSNTSGTPASTDTPERGTVSETLDRIAKQPVSLVSDVLHCDRGNYLPGLSTDGDLATVQAYNIGAGSNKLEKDSDHVVFDPLSVDYVREHCQQAEETERLSRTARQKMEQSDSDDLSAVTLTFDSTTETTDETTTEDGRETPEADRGVLTLQDSLKSLTIEPFLRKRAEEEKLVATLPEAGGDGVDVSSKTKIESPEKVAELLDAVVTAQLAEAEIIA